MARRRLCALSDLPDPGSLGFSVSIGGDALELFIVRRDGLVRAYRNSCPHTGASLEWMPNVFLDLTGELIQCGLHGALFRIETGECIHGPCLGRFLTPLAVRVEAGEVVLASGPE